MCMYLGVCYIACGVNVYVVCMHVCVCVRVHRFETGVSLEITVASHSHLL